MDVSKWYFLAWWTLPTMGRFFCFLFPLGWFNWGTIQNYAPHLPPKFKLVDSKKEQTCGSKRTPDFWLPGCHLLFFWKFYIQWLIIIFLIQIAILEAIPYFQTHRHSVGYITSLCLMAESLCLAGLNPYLLDGLNPLGWSQLEEA